MDTIWHAIPHLQMIFLPRILEAIAIREFMDIVVVRRYKRQVYYIIWYPVFVLWLYAVSLLAIPEPAELLVNMLFSLFTVSLLYTGSKVQYLAAAVIAIAGNKLFDIFMTQGYALLFHIDIKSVAANSVELFGVIMLTKLTEMLLVKIMRGIVGCRRIKGLKNEDYFLYFLMPIVSVVVMNLLFADCVRHGTMSDILMYAMLGIVVLDIAIFHMMHRMESYYKSESNLRVLYSQATAQMENIAAVEQTHKRLRQISHGITTQLSAIETLLRHHKYQEAEDYLKSITDTVKQDMLPIHTNNVVVDALLNQKYILAHAKGIKMQFDIQDLQNLRIRTTDMVSILSNGLNNAIEACQAVEGNRMIELKIINGDSELLISIQNTVRQDIAIEGSLIPTSKADKFHHGLGLEGINAVVKRYNGTLFLECENRIFKLIAVINS